MLSNTCNCGSCLQRKCGSSSFHTTVRSPYMTCDCRKSTYAFSASRQPTTTVFSSGKSPTTRNVSKRQLAVTSCRSTANRSTRAATATRCADAYTSMEMESEKERTFRCFLLLCKAIMMTLLRGLFDRK